MTISLRKIEPNSTVIFNHIPKTAGMSLNSLIERQYDTAVTYKTDPNLFWESIDLFKNLPDTRRAQLKLVTGHMIFGFHQYLSQPYTYITVLRDPVDRVISYYYYILGFPGHYLYEIVHTQGMSLKDLVSGGISNEFDNLQSRRLSGNDKIRFGQCPPDMLEQAEQNMRQHYGVIGVMEKFDETLLLMKATFGWKNCFYEKKNVTKKRPKKRDIPSDTLDVIKEHNKMDIELYERAKIMFENQIGQLGQSFHEDLEKFRSLNKIYQVFHPVIHKTKRKLAQIGLS
jgi:hypothetical protein